jgi:hypothetical protein
MSKGRCFSKITIHGIGNTKPFGCQIFFCGWSVKNQSYELANIIKLFNVHTFKVGSVFQKSTFIVLARQIIFVIEHCTRML